MTAPVEALAAYLRPLSAAPAGVPLDVEICHHLREQGVGPLVYRALREWQLFDEQPSEVRDELARVSREEAVIEPFRRAAAARVLDALGAAGVDTLVFKGTALAYTCYLEPHFRPRLDTDLLIRRADVNTASRVFEHLGYRRALRTSGEHVTHQFTYVSTRHGLQLAFDVHWKLSDPQAFADLFSFGELADAAVPAPALAPAARAMGHEHALLVACTHRIAHHFDRTILIDLYDIDLLTRRLGPAAWERVVALATGKRISKVTLRSLDLAANLLGTPIPGHVRQALASSPADEPTSAYLAEGFRRVDVLKADLRALGWRDRFTLVREHLLPPPVFVLRSAGQTRPALLPALYLLRIARGAHAWFRPLR